MKEIYKIKKYKIKIKSNTPVVWNRLKMEIRNLLKTLKKDELEENELKNWKMKAEIKNGKAIIPPEWILGGLVNAAKETRIIPWFATSKNQTYTKYLSNLKISPGEEIIAGDANDLKRKDAMLGSQGKMGGKVMRCHPMLEEWEAEFIIVDTVGKMKLIELEALFRWMGTAVGIGDQRYANFGRFELIKIEEVN